MDVRKRKRLVAANTNDVNEDDDEDKHKRKRHVIHVPSPPSPPEDSNDREVSMILGITSNTRETESSSQHYSKHSSLLTDLSLTPSPTTSDKEVVKNDNDTKNDDDNDSLEANVSSNQDQSSVESSDEVDTTDQPDEAEDILTTPLNEELSLHQLNTPEADPEASSPHYNTPELSSTCPTTTSTPLVQQQQQQHFSFHSDILNLDPNQSHSPLLPPKPSTINNNKRCQTPTGSLGSPSYCSQSPAYSIPSPGSAFSVVISRRRESES